MKYTFDGEVVLDLETLGKVAGAALLSIGACTIDGAEKFYVAINVESCCEAGLTADIDTVDWWNRQSKAARAAAFSGDTPLEIALELFSRWYNDVQAKATANGNTLGIWGNGAGFDQPILEAAYRACAMEVPWSYKELRCYRTLKALLPEVPLGTNIGTAHHALDDALFEAEHLRRLLAHIYK